MLKLSLRCLRLLICCRSCCCCCCWLSLDRASNAKTTAQFTYNAHQSNGLQLQSCHCHRAPLWHHRFSPSPPIFVVAVLYLPFYPAFWARQSSVLVVRLQQLANRPKRPTNRPTTLAAMTQRLTACRRCLEAWLTWVIKQPKCAHKTQPAMTLTTKPANQTTQPFVCPFDWQRWVDSDGNWQLATCDSQLAAATLRLCATVRPLP